MYLILPTDYYVCLPPHLKELYFNRCMVWQFEQKMYMRWRGKQVFRSIAPDLFPHSVVSQDYSSIFTYDYEKIKTHCMIYKEELIQEQFHSKNIHKFPGWKIDGF